MKPLLVADHPALELLDTTLVFRGEPVELIGDGHAFLDWLVEADLLPATTASWLKRRFSAQELDAAAVEARQLRAWAAEWFARWRVAPNEPYEKQLRKLNALLSRSNDHRELTRVDGRLAVVERHRIEAPSALIGLLAAQIADLVAKEEPALVKQCAGSECTLWFVDRTKAHRRRFCSAAACGNREKVAAFRARERQRAKDD